MEYDAWFRGKTFSTDWSSHFFPQWEEILLRLRDRSISVLEIGSWEGRSAIFFLEYLPHCRLTCIDTFEGGIEHAGMPDIVSSTEARFDANLSAYGTRVRKLKSRSLAALDSLNRANERFEVIYIDGSHQRDDVLIDSTLAWPLLKDGGICIWDDYAWGLDQPAEQRPQPAIDAFLQLHADELRIMHVAKQAIVSKQAGGGSTQVDAARVFPRTLTNVKRFLSKQPLLP